MSDLEVLYERNGKFAASFDQGGLPMTPNLMTIVLTCVDARVDPAHFAGLGLGDALVLRTVGARATDTAILEVAVLWQLLKLGADGADPDLGLAIVHHTNCGMARFAQPEVAQAVTGVFGTADVVNTYAIADSHEAVREDVERAKAGPHTPRGLTVSGHLYDVTTGRLEQVVAPATV